jgi:hypothetical protein
MGPRISRDELVYYCFVNSHPDTCGGEKEVRRDGLKGEDLLRPGKYGKVVEGRDLLCYWAVQELGWSVMGLAKRIGISQPAVSYAIQRGQRVVREKGLQSVPK